MLTGKGAKNMCIYKGVRKLDHSSSQNQTIHKLYFKKGVYHIPGGAEKGDIRHTHPYYFIYRVPPNRGFKPFICMVQDLLK